MEPFLSSPHQMPACTIDECAAERTISKRTPCGTTPPAWSPGLPLDQPSSPWREHRLEGASPRQATWSEVPLGCPCHRVCHLLEAPHARGYPRGSRSSLPVASLPLRPNTTSSHKPDQTRPRHGKMRLFIVTSSASWCMLATALLLSGSAAAVPCNGMAKRTVPAVTAVRRG